MATKKKPAVELVSAQEIERDVREALEHIKKDHPVTQLVENALRQEKLTIVRRVMGLDIHGPRIPGRKTPGELTKKLETAGNRWIRAFLKEAKPTLTEVETKKLQTAFRQTYSRKLLHMIEHMAERAAYADAAVMFEQLTGRKIPKFDKRRNWVRRGYY